MRTILNESIPLNGSQKKIFLNHKWCGKLSWILSNPKYKLRQVQTKTVKVVFNRKAHYNTKPSLLEKQEERIKTIQMMQNYIEGSR